MGMYTQILVRSDVPPLSLVHAVAAQVNAIDPDQQVNGQVQNLEQWITSQPEWQQEQLVAWIFGGFAVLALALAAVGLYSVVSYTVAQRTNEFGIRMALGAQRGHVLAIVFASTVVSVGGGILAGLALTLALHKVLAQWAEGSSRDPLILLAVTLLLSAVATIACVLPARRASRVDPMTALRYE
jgi:ABC-type antimicrobial peptide transport system permease subunit